MNFSFGNVWANIKNKLNINHAIYSVFFLFCTAFLLLFSASTSPLYTELCDGDSGIFILIGKAITLGKNVYTDYFDHKGPLLFYINALGYAMTGSRTGIFILQCLNLSFASVLMYKTARQFTGTIRSVICVVITALAFAATISDGNLSEEYCLLPCFASIYPAARFMRAGRNKAHPRRYMLLYGICFGICAFIRVNNGLMICAIVFVALLTDFTNEHIKEAFINLSFFLLGITLIAVPICLFFLIRGNLSEMLFATFVFNFLYATAGATEKNTPELFTLIKWIMPALALIILPPLFARRIGAKTASLLTTLSVFSLIPLLLGFSYTHYYTSLLPLITLYCAMFFRIIGRKIRPFSVILCIAMIFPLSMYFVSLPSNTATYVNLVYKQRAAKSDADRSSIYLSAKEFTSLIPEDERDSVFGYDVSAAWFLYADIMPCFNIFTLQESWAANYPEFGRQINEMMTDNPPKWVIIHNISIVKSRQFLNIINSNYELVAENGHDLLYKIRPDII